MNAMKRRFIGIFEPDCANAFKENWRQNKAARHPTPSPLLHPALAFLLMVLVMFTTLSHAQQPTEAAVEQLWNQLFDQSQAGNYAEAAATAEKRLEMTARLRGPNHPDTAMAQRWVGMMYQKLGRQQEAGDYFQRSLAIFEKHPDRGFDTASALEFLADLHSSQGRYEEAVQLRHRSIGVYEKALAGQELDLMEPLDNLAHLYVKLGRYAEAEPLYRRTLAILEKNQLAESTDAAKSHRFLGDLYANQSRYAEAETLFQRSLELYEKHAVGPHPGPANTLNSLALVLYKSQGRHADVEPLFRRAIAIYQELLDILGTPPPGMANALNNYASWCKDQQRFAEAGELFRRSLAIMESQLGPGHLDTAVAMNNLADLYQVSGRAAEAEPLYLRSLEIKEQQLGASHPETARTLNNLAGWHAEQGNIAEAEKYFRRTLEIFETHLDPHHPHTATALGNLALIYQGQGRHAEAEPLVARNLASTTAQWRRVLAYFSERECLGFQRAERPFTNPGNQGSGRLAAEAQLLFKGAVVEAMNARRKAEARLANTPDGQRLLAERNELRNQYQKDYLAKGAQDDEVKSLEARLEALERKAAALSGVGDGATLMTTGLDQVQAALGSGQALVETFRYGHRHDHNTWEFRYASTVITATGEPAFVSHGSAEPIENAIRRYRDLLQAGGAAANPEDAKQKSGELAKAEAALYAALLAPLEEHIGSAETVVFSPDAQLHFLPLGLIRNTAGSTFNDRYQVRYVSSGRDLVKNTTSRSQTGRSALLLGNPTYRDNAPLTALAEAEEANDQTRNQLSENLRAGLGQDSGSIQFRPLPGTARETALLSDQLKTAGYNVVSLVGREATEQATMKQIGGHRIVHLATHGFFLGEITVGNEDASLSRSVDMGESPIQDPMFRSGLALAGAQSTFNLWKSGQVPPPSRDGVLLAAEITGIDLLGTDLVVLSACETAAGESLDGEGVIGLRRALNTAGAPNLVMTLWPVSDTATVELMEVFYQKYLSGIPAAKALAETQRELLPQWIDAHGDVEALARLAPFLCATLGPVE